jgi:multiple sugar transport system permease protein
MRNPGMGNKVHRKSQMNAWLFLTPSLLVLTIFVFIPLIMAFGISLTNIDIYMKNFSFCGFKNYHDLFTDNRVGNATINTLCFALAEVPIQIAFALLICLLMIANNRFHKFVRSVFYLPYVCSMTAISIMWTMLLNPNFGMISSLLRKIGIVMPNMLQSTTLAMPVIVFVTVWKNFGYTLTILSAAALGVSNSLYEAAAIDGAGSVQKFFYITVPGIRRSINFCLVTTLITALQVFDQIYVMTSGGPQYKTETLVGYIYNRGFQTAPYNLGYASAISVYLFIIIAFITIVLRKYILQEGEEE